MRLIKYLQAVFGCFFFFPVWKLFSLLSAADEGQNSPVIFNRVFCSQPPNSTISYIYITTIAKKKSISPAGLSSSVQTQSASWGFFLFPVVKSWFSVISFLLPLFHLEWNISPRKLAGWPHGHPLRMCCFRQCHSPLIPAHVLYLSGIGQRCTKM